MAESERLLRPGRRPSEGEVVSIARPQRLVALAEDVADLTRNRARLRGLRMAGHDVLLMWSRGTPGARLADLTGRHPLRAGVPVVTAIEEDPEALRLLAAADGVIGLGEAAREVLEEVAARGRTRAVPPSDLVGWGTVARTWPQLRAHADHGILTRRYARHLIALTGILEDPAPPSVQVALTDLVAALEQGGSRDEAVALLPHLRAEDPDPAEAARRRAVTAQVRTSAAGSEDPDLRASAADLLVVADAVLATGDVAGAARLATVCLASFFHVELHGDGLSTPLVDDPDGFLGAWRGSRVGRLLAAPVPRPERRGDPAGAGPRRVVVAPGSYPRFADQLLAELQGRADVDVTALDWGERRGARGLGVHEGLVEQRLRAAVGEAAREPDVSTLFDDADAVFVDWADRGAVLALLHVPKGVRVTLRVHSMDALAPWLHLVDWSVVDHLVLVSEPLRDVVVGLLGDRLTGTALHVVPNTVDLTRIPTTKADGHLRRLLMVGWAPRVKDVEWALDVVDLLRADDPRWRLTLVGPEKGTRQGVRSSREHAERVRARLERATADGSVEVVPETRDLAPWWRSAGFTINTSRRESFGLAVVEAVVSGAVPVVRNWPILAGLDGAARVFPRSWVVDTVEQAAERIRSCSEPAAWQREAAEARAFVERELLGRDPARTLADLTLGP